MINQTPQYFHVETFKIYEEKKINKRVLFFNTLTIKAPADDFIESIEASIGDYIKPGTILLVMENKEESYQLAKSKNEFAISLLNSGTAIQEEKKKAVELAENRLENTKVRTPIEGYILKIPVDEKLFVSKGTVLFEILPMGTKPYLQISFEEKKILENAEFVEMKLYPTKLKRLLNEKQIIEDDNNHYLLLPLDFSTLDSQLLDSLYCELNITYIEKKASWIPNEYVNEETVYIKGDRKKEIQVLEQKNDLLLVSGLDDEDILIKKR